MRFKKNLLKDLGEDEVIRQLTLSWKKKNKRVLYGIGHDCAVLNLSQSEGKLCLFKTDAVVEGIHFLKQEKPERVGWKALARCVSDIAAMGGLPTAALITLGAPLTTRLERVLGFYRGIEKCAKCYGINLVGGETTRASQFFLSIALLGEVKRKELVLRSGAESGDFIFVTGTLGGSRKGKHLDFVPRLQEAQWLVKHVKPSAMMDISDGLGKDLLRLCQMSDVDFEVEEEKLPITRGATKKQAWSEGEDFELLFTLKPKVAEKLQQHWPLQTRLTQIGVIKKKGAKKKKSKYLKTYGGFDHFQ
ncbi:MAG: thiamine-phosphate kinase [Verrucomicrobiae bacterium]|nr:thiamine-phosphate kinase [Verrucomicrobiae bacterium]